ncbi:MAG: cytochrome c oxidase assembly protein, partial [Armatimonadota bacterium]|nr:cytochrome c oxidase assembly protein [Armatimonadota bacterium]
RATPRHRLWFWSGLASVAVAVLSPLEAGARLLLWLHMVQHLVLVLVAGPLLAASLPAPFLGWLTRRPGPVTSHRYPQEHWRHLRTVNVVESPFAALRLRTDAAKRFKKVERAAAVIWKMLMVAQTRFRRLNAPELLAKVYVGVRYEDGIEAAGKEVAA